MPYCVICGHKNEDDARFCISCGAELAAPGSGVLPDAEAGGAAEIGFAEVEGPEPAEVRDAPGREGTDGETNKDEGEVKSAKKRPRRKKAENPDESGPARLPGVKSEEPDAGETEERADGEIAAEIEAGLSERVETRTESSAGPETAAEPEETAAGNPQDPPPDETAGSVKTPPAGADGAQSVGEGIFFSPESPETGTEVPPARPTGYIAPAMPERIDGNAGYRPQYAAAAYADTVSPESLRMPESPVPSIPETADGKQVYAKPLSTAAFFWLKVLYIIPVFGFVLALIMSFAPRNANLRHFSRATLIFQIIAFILLLILWLVAVIVAQHNGWDFWGGESWMHYGFDNFLWPWA